MPNSLIKLSLTMLLGALALISIDVFAHGVDDNTRAFLEQNQEKTVLIVGHSNTTPKLVNAIMEKEIFKQMQDNDNSSLFIVRELYGEKTVEHIFVGQ